MSAVEVRGVNGFQHEAFFYRDLEGFLEGTAPFVEAGMAAGEAVLVAVGRERMEALQSAVTPSDELLQFADMAELGRNPGRIISAWARFFDENTRIGRPVRGIGEPIWDGRTPAELVECQRHEALLNTAFAHAKGFRLICPYDTTSLSESVLAEARRSHPYLTEEGTTRTSHRYLAQPGSPFEGELPEPPATAELLVVADLGVSGVRRRVLESVTSAGLDPSRAADFVLAVTEAVTNTVRHAGGGGVVRLWQKGSTVFCDVRDRGRIRDPLAGRLPVEIDESTGRGLWLINQLCDLVQIRSGDAGNVVRMSMTV